MKKSHYNMVSPYNGRFIHYNMLTKAILLSDSPNLDPNNPVFYENGFFVDDSVDELKLSEKALVKEQMNSTHLLLTIIPTLNCNLDCIYCYQHDMHNSAKRISRNTLHGIIAEIQQDDELTSVHVEWNGGEPLLEIELIKQFSSELVELCDRKGIAYTSSISTNLFALNDEIVENLITARISSVDTTLAGTANVHDKYRLVRYEKKGSFHKVWDNIQRILKTIPLSICINVTADSEPDTYRLIDMITEIKSENLSISFLLIEDYGFGDKDIFLDKETYFPVMLRLLEYAISRGLKAEVNSNFGCKYVFCAAQINKSYLIHPSGRIYKCANDYSIENSIGIVSNNGFILSGTQPPFNPYLDENCRYCNILPYCNGGCHYARHRETNFCPHEKNYITELLKLYVSSNFGIT